jgi:molecular chaperone GrpE
MTGSGPQATESAELRRLVEERTADLQRVKAEYDNYRKRVRRDHLAVREIAVANVLRALLPVLDAVDRACGHEPLTPGLEEIADSLREQLGSLGVTSFGEVGEPFDPACHDALAHHASPGRDRLVCSAVLRPGYRLGDHLLRPAHVEVAGPAPPPRNAHGGGRGIRPATDGGAPPFPIARGRPGSGRTIRIDGDRRRLPGYRERGHRTDAVDAPTSGGDERCSTTSTSPAYASSANTAARKRPRRSPKPS